MRNYSFKTLNDKEFEILIRDLLSAELGLEFRSFKAGKDKGIDLRYSTDLNNKIVVQVKHYANSKYAQLKYQLKNEELPKVKKLKPERYIIATYLELSPTEVDEIKDIFAPFILSAGDIYWNQTINSLLAKFDNIERDHFKLWFSSSSVLSNILNNSAYLKSAYLLNELESKVGHYVKTDFHSKAKEILKSQKVLLITGAPGVGKTTLAQMIILEYVKDGFEHLVIEDRISEVENIISQDKSKKQIIYFDDFLGSNVYEILNPRNNENSLVRFINRVKANPNKYIVLTTRTTILNQALSSYEKLRYNRLHKDSNFEIYLDDYSLFQKAKILYNHIYFGNLERAYRDHIFSNKNYMKIIEHDNYNPRLIEFFTNRVHLIEVESSHYLNFILTNLDNPEEIWRSSYENQINEEERFMLVSLYSLKGESRLEILEKVYNSRIRNEVKNFGYQAKNDSFNKALKNLQGSYVEITYNGRNRVSTISFINPSVSDFLINYLQQSNFEKRRLFEGVLFIRQILNVFHPVLEKHLNFNIEEGKYYYKTILANEKIIRDQENSINFSLKFLRVLFSVFYNIVEDKTVIRFFKELNIESIDYSNVDDYLFILENVSYIDELNNLIVEQWNSIALNLFDSSEDEYRYDKIVDLFDLYEQSYEEFSNEPDNYDTLYNLFSEFLSELISERIYENLHEFDYSPTDEYQYDHYREVYYYELVGFKFNGDIDSIISDELDEFQKMSFLARGCYITSSDLNIDRLALVERMEDRYLEYQIDSSDYEDYQRPGIVTDNSVDWSSEVDRINDLFEE